MNYHNIIKTDMLNGMGLRVSLFISGCENNCKGCFNPQTHDPNSGVLFDENAEKELFEALDHDYIAGLSLLGGDPLYPKNRFPVFTLLSRVKNKFPKKNIWLYTGYTWEEIQCMPNALAILDFVDILCEGRFVESLKDNTSNCRWVGSSNQRVIDVKNTLKEGKVILYEG